MWKVLLAGVTAWCMAWSAGAATLQWDPNMESDLAGYRVYRMLQPCENDGPPEFLEDVKDATQYRDDTVPVGSSACWEITAYDTANNESPRSRRAGITVPPPPTNVCLKENPRGKCVKYAN